MPPTVDELRAFLDRPWAELRDLKDRHVAETVQRRGVDEAFRLAELLRAQAELMGARATDEQRAADLATAVRMKGLLDRASRRSRRAR